MQTLLAQLKVVLAPLFELYGITDPLIDKAAVRLLLADVRIVKDDGIVTIYNRSTGAVIFKGSLRNLAGGSFYPENMPPGPGTPPSTCASFTYSTWGACQPGGTQTCTVLSSSPAGCTGGSPVTTQACTYVPPPPATCTGFTFSTWGACQPDNTQNRTLLSSSPTGCTGGSPITAQACTYVPPPTTCSSFTYSAWASCQPSNTQTRSVVTSSPTGCTGGAPVTSQACTYVASNPVTNANIVSSCTGCHGLTSNTTVFKSGGYTVTGRSASQWLSTVNSMVNKGSSLAAGTTAQNYADYLANAP